MQVSGNTIMITGGGRGIGRGLAEASGNYEAFFRMFNERAASAHETF